MCRPASFVVTKKEVFWSKSTDSHEDIIDEFKLREIDIRNKPTLVRIEIVPPDRNFCLPLKQWIYSLDQDIKPEWYDAKDVERRARAKLKEWRECKVVLPNRHRIAKNNDCVYAMGDSTVRAMGRSTVRAQGDSSVVAMGRSTVEAIGNCTVKATGYCTVEAQDNCTVEARGNCTVEAWGNCTVEAQDNCTVEARGNCTVKARGNCTVKVWDKCAVEAWGNSTVIGYVRLDKAILHGANAVLVDRSELNTKCYYDGYTKGI